MQQRYQEVKAIVVDDEFWDTLRGALCLMSPTAALIRMTDSDRPTASKVHYNQFIIQEDLQKMDFSFLGEDEARCTRQTVICIHLARWDYGFSPIQGAGYLLDPEFIDMHEEVDNEIMDAFTTMVEKTYCFSKQPPDDCSSEGVA